MYVPGTIRTFLVYNLKWNKSEFTNMRTLVISDLHYEKRTFRGMDKSKAWSWLMSIVDYHKPDLLLSCGDWGSAVTLVEFCTILEKTVVLTIYGNHENMPVLESLHNVKEPLPVLLKVW